jgi:hypothetical protein
MGERHAFAWTMALFAVLWAAFYGLYHAFPYVKNGSDVVFNAKLRFEQSGRVFPADSQKTRVLIFGNSKILAGFLPSRFDELSGTSSFNSGFPGSDVFLAPLQTMCARGQAPNILLLTLPWDIDPPRRGIFHFIPDDHAVIGLLFPFRDFMRDLTAFLMNAPSHGGVKQYYHESEKNEAALIADRGYHLITEQSHFPGGRLPDDFHLASDQPGIATRRIVPGASTQAEQLDQLLQQYHIRCYYVPYYLREGEAAPSAYDNDFATALEQNTTCHLLGPDYFLYPNRYFADQTHLNKDGARVYTEALFGLLKEAHALQ